MMSDTDLASYADDDTPYVSADTIDEVIRKLETASVKLFRWFADNQMKANQDKCHVIAGSEPGGGPRGLVPTLKFNF